MEQSNCESRSRIFNNSHFYDTSRLPTTANNQNVLTLNLNKRLFFSVVHKSKNVTMFPSVCNKGIDIDDSIVQQQ